MRKIRFYEQADRTGNKITYSWMIDGFPYSQRKHLPGWTWIKGAGCRGSFVTNNAKLAVDTLWDLAKKHIVGLDCESNGTHAVCGAPRFIGSAFHNPEEKFEHSQDGFVYAIVED